MDRSSIMKVLDGETVYPPPIWMMRQAGRYLPEYREVRKAAGSFLDLCYNPQLATEVTLQPIRRYGFDAAILFSDILVVPHALGRDLTFTEGHGPMMTPIRPEEIGLIDASMFHVNLEPVYQAVASIKSKLDRRTALLGFCGAPWTVATYMIAGKGTPDQAPARLFAHRFPQQFDALMLLLAEQSAAYLLRQLEAGADAVQIFDSWSSVLDEGMFERACVKPVKRMIDLIRAVRPNAKIIGFPKGASALLRGYRERTGVDAVGLDWAMPDWLAQEIQSGGPVQGNMDPLRVVAGGKALEDGVAHVLRTLGGGPLIFNLGHGITPEASPDEVARLVELVRRG